MSERTIVVLGVVALLVAVASVALIVEGGLVALPLAVVLGVTSAIGGLVKHPPRSGRIKTGMFLGVFTVIAVLGFAFYGIVLA